MEFDYPIFFTPTRVWRCYTGGVLLDRFVGSSTETDGYEPEDWLASVVHAENREHSKGPEEGLSRVLYPNGTPGPLLAELLQNNGEQILGPKHFAKCEANTTILCKYLDSAIRLPVQCHPDVPMARSIFNSNFGKTESWHILDTRKIDGQEPYILMGFKQGVTKEGFAEVADKQDIGAMENMLHKILVKPGETYFVPGRLPHAIGTGVFMLEVQEPSDLVVTPERYCAGIRLTDEEMWCSLTQQQGLDIFAYEAISKEELLRRVVPGEKVVRDDAGCTIKEIIGPAYTEAFLLMQATVNATATIKLARAFGIVVVVGGSGEMSWPNGSRAIKSGDYFLQPATVPEIEYSCEAGKPLTLMLCLPGTDYSK